MTTGTSLRRKGLKAGDFVRLSPSAKHHRIEWMDKWDGMVEEVGVGFLLNDKEHSIREVLRWIRVNWGKHVMGKGDLIWLEKEENLVLN